MMKTARAPLSMLGVATGALLSLAFAAQSAEPGDATAGGTKKAQLREAAARATQVDRLELDATVVTGDSELPKVLYIVPWKKADLGELPGQPFNTLLDEVLQPLDRDVFRREVKYYHAVTQGAEAHEPASAPPR